MTAAAIIILFSHLKQGGVTKPFECDLCVSSTLGTSGVSFQHLSSLQKQPRLKKHHIENAAGKKVASATIFVPREWSKNGGGKNEPFMSMISMVINKS